MNQQLFKWLHAISVIIFLFFIGSYSVEASEMTFSVKAILPDNQRTKETSYFDLRVAPNTKATNRTNESNSQRHYRASFSQCSDY